MTEHADVTDLIDPLIAFRRDIHRHPELGFAEHRTAARIADALRELGLEVYEGIGTTGVVGVLKVGDSPRSIGLRADMDALPIEERTGLTYASCTPGIFHGCGHDGHVAMLVGAARQLARSRQFDGTVNFIFQPAEEGLGGASAMVADGLFDRFPCDRIFALHNWPDLPAGTIATRAGPIMAAADRFEIILRGNGTHAALPHKSPDAILAASELVVLLNTIIGRRIPPTSSAVISVTQFHGGDTHNVIPATVKVSGTVRSFDAEVQNIIETEIKRIAAGVALAHGLEVDARYSRYYPATINDPDAVDAALAAAALIGEAVRAPSPAFTSEDFALMLQACPGAYLWLGQGKSDQYCPLHHPGYDFNDEVLATGVCLHVALVEAHLKR